MKKLICVNALTGQTSFLHYERNQTLGSTGCVNALTGQTSFLRD